MAGLQFFVLAPVEPEVSLYRLCVVCGCQVIQRLQRVGRERIVRFQDGYVFARCSIEPLVHGCSIAGIGFVNHAKAAVRVKIFLHNGTGAVGAAVVNADCLEIGEALGQHGIQAFAQVFLHVVNGYKQANCGHGGSFRYCCAACVLFNISMIKVMARVACSAGASLAKRDKNGLGLMGSMCRRLV